MGLDWMQYFTVQVERGSGCLFQPLDDSYSYVLTAKHVIENISDFTKIKITRYTGSKYKEVKVLEKPYPHPHPTKDAAIIKVEKVENLGLLLRADTDFYNEDKWFLCGYPSIRKEDEFPFRKDSITIMNNTTNGLIEAQLNNATTHSEIEGQSGGGIIKSDNSYFCLLGIQVEMASKKEELSRIHFASLSIFDEIIEENKENLSYLLPPYIGSFKYLVEEVLSLEKLMVNRDLVCKTLRAISKKICKEVSPKEILASYGNRYLAEGTPKHIINHKQIWISLLELLTIINLYGESIDYLNLQEIHKKRKLLIVDTDNWIKKLENIYNTDLTEVENGGSIIVCATKEKEPALTEISPELLEIADISIPAQEEMQINSTIQNPFRDIKLINIFKFQKYLFENMLHLAQIDRSNARSKLKEITNGVI